MSDIKLQDLTPADAFTARDFLAGVRDNGNGTFSDFRYSAAQVATFIQNYDPTIASHWGYKDSTDPLTALQIAAATPYDYIPLADITAYFINPQPQYLWLAYPATETGITNYFISTLDFGQLGPEGTFSSPALIGDYFYIQSNYPTSSVTVQFKH